MNPPGARQPPSSAASSWLAWVSWLAIGAFLLANVAFVVTRVPFDMLDADELQHAHIAWLVAGGKILYRDFWEHHGPFFGLMNGLILSISDARPSIDLLLRCREAAAVATAGIALLTWRIARQLRLEPRAAVTAAAIFLSLAYVQDKGPECRPDAWQNLFWMAGLSLALSNLSKRRIGVALAAGAVLGLAVLTNLKVGIGPFALFLYYVLGQRSHGLAPRAVVTDLAALAVGAAAVYAGFLAYFLAHDAARAFHVFTISWNFLAAGEISGDGRAAAQLGFMLKRQLPFMLAVVVGAALWLRDIRQPIGTLARPGGALVLVAALVTGTSWLSNNYPQLFLIFLPLWSLLATFGLFALLAWARQYAGVAGASLLATVAAAAMLATSQRQALYGEQEMLRFQKRFTATMLIATPRTEAIGVIWDVCGGFMFNAPLQYYWAGDPAVARTVARDTGTNPFGQPFIDALERERVRYVVGRDGPMLGGLPEVTQRYLREHYAYDNCLWTRKRAALTGATSSP